MKLNLNTAAHRLAFSAITLLFVSCHPTPGPDKTFAGAVLGAGWGAGAGAIIGNQTNNTGPGIAIGAGFGALSGIMTGIGLDVSEGTELQQQREIDALKVQVASNQRSITFMQGILDDRERRLVRTSGEEKIFFDEGRASLRIGAALQLERMANSIKRNPYVGKIEIHGHTDDTGNQDLNARLSEARARTVAGFFMNQGISSDQLATYTHGADRPLSSNEIEAGRQLNRRVEVVLTR